MLNLIPNPHPLVFQLFAVSYYKWGARGLWIIRLPCSVGYTLFLLISTKLQVREWQTSSHADRLQVQFVYSTLSLQADTRCTQVYMYCDLAIPTKTNVFILLFLCRDVFVCLFCFSLFLSSAKTITVCCLPPYCDCLFVGTLGGITYPMDTEFDGMSPEVLSWSRARA